MKTLILSSVAVIAALLLLPVDLSVQVSVYFAAGLVALLTTDYARQPKSLALEAAPVAVRMSSERTALPLAA